VVAGHALGNAAVLRAVTTSTSSPGNKVPAGVASVVVPAPVMPDRATLPLCDPLTTSVTSADPGKIAQSVYFSSPMSKMCLLGAALNRLERDGAITWMYVTRQDMERFGALDEDCEGLVNYALGISGVEVAIFFREVAQERIRVSIRSKGAVNVAEIAQKFGGGGHECAGGFSTEGPVEEAAKRVLAELRRKVPQSGT